MTAILWFRRIVFTLLTLLSSAVLGVCAYLEYLAAGYTDGYLSFIPLGLAASSLTIISLPLFLWLGHRPRRLFTSVIVFEIVWFFILWLLWVATAGEAVAGKSTGFPAGCVYGDYPGHANQICYEFTVVEALAFVNFLCAFIYYDVILMYAIINAIRGRSIWVASVKEATVVPGAVSPVDQPRFGAAPATQYQTYGAYPSVPQPYNAYPQQVPGSMSPAPPYNAYPQQLLPPQGPVPQQYHAYPQQVPPQGPVPQQFGGYPAQVPPQSPPAMQLGQSQLYHQPAVVAPQQQIAYTGYAPSPARDISVPPQPNYGAHPVHGVQSQLPLPSGYPGLPAALPSV